MNDRSDEDRFRRYLPWYVNNTLEADERAWLENFLERDPALRNELRLEQLLRSALREDEIAYDGKEGLPRFLQHLGTDPVAHPVRRWMERLGIRSGSPAVAVFATLVVLQIGLLGVWYSRGNTLGSTHKDEEMWRTTAGVGTAGPVLRITFKPGTEERELRLLLVRVHGTIVGGPGQLGNYIVKVPVDMIEAMEKQVSAATIVESVERLNEPPNPD